MTTVLVTGASSYIGSHIIQLLQKRGYRVRGTVRSLKNGDRVKPLLHLCPEAAFPLELVEADLTKDDGWLDAVSKCTYVLHVASPFPNTAPKRPEDIIQPAVEGTVRVLQACAEAGCVKRVVLTSSMGAVHGETVTDKGRIYTEDDWSDVKSPHLDAYAKSKTLAEKAAWDFVNKLPEGKKFELAVLNPGLVFGPILTGVYGTSVECIKRLLDRSAPMIPNTNFAICDVHDVAEAHLKAMIVPEAAGHRHLIITDSYWYREIAIILYEEFGPQGFFIPRWTAPFLAVWMASFLDGAAALMLPRWGKTFRYSNKRMREVLGINPRDARQSITETAYSLIEAGVIQKTRKYRPQSTEGSNRP